MEGTKPVLVLAVVLGLCLVILFVAFGNPTTGYGYSVDESVPPHSCTDLTASEATPDGSTPFVEVAQKAGLLYESEESNGLEGVNNASVYVTDYNNDGMSDLLAIGCAKTMLFENEGGEYGVSGALPDMNITATAALFFDYDNDGWDDLLLLPKYTDPKGEPVFLENHEGEFSEREEMFDVELNATRGATAADYTGNGCLDVFIVQAGNWEKNRPMGYGSTTETNATASETLGNGGQNRLFAGDCRGFEEMTEEAGIWGSSWSLATSFVDLTNDGYPDIHVANDFNNDVVYINEGDGTFDRRVLPDSTNRNGMSSEVADVDGDGYLDIFVTNIYHSGAEGAYLSSRLGDRIDGNNLLINQGNGTFVDRAEEYGVLRGGWGWSALLEDFDNDGYRDLYHSNTYNINGSRKTKGGYYWEGTQDGFERLNSTRMGFVESQPVSTVRLDYDLDGRVDIATSDIKGNFHLYENRFDAGNSLQVDLEATNRTDIGSRIYVEGEDNEWMRVKQSNTDYMSQSSRVLHFGVGSNDEVDVQVEWNGGGTTTLEQVDTGQRISVTQAGIIDRMEYNQDSE